jgi:hypothetical protein
MDSGVADDQATAPTDASEILSLSLQRAADGSWRMVMRTGDRIVRNDRHLSGAQALSAAARLVRSTELGAIIQHEDRGPTSACQMVRAQARWRLKKDPHHAPTAEILELAVVHDVPNGRFRVLVANDPPAYRRDWCPPTDGLDPGPLLEALSHVGPLGGEVSDRTVHRIRECPTNPAALDPDAYLRHRRTRFQPLRLLDTIRCQSLEAHCHVVRVHGPRELTGRLWAIRDGAPPSLAIALDPASLAIAGDVMSLNSWDLLNQERPASLRRIHDGARQVRDVLSSQLSDRPSEAELVRIDELEFARRIVAHVLGAQLGPARLGDGQPLLSSAAADARLEPFLPIVPERKRASFRDAR